MSFFLDKKKGPKGPLSREFSKEDQLTSCQTRVAAAVIWLIAIVEGVIYLTRSQTDFDRIYVLNQRDWF